MIALLSRLFIKGDRREDPDALRTAYGILCGAVGIVLNILLFAGKFFAGVISGSIAITADAFNNLSDAGSSFVTLLGFRLASLRPDRHHPFGHGRFEYISGLVVAILILLMGVELLQNSLLKILHPEPVEASLPVFLILLASIAVKGYMWAYNRQIGKKLHSPAMEATAADSLSDCVSTAAVLIATLAGLLWQVRIDGWCGLLVSLFILLSGVGAARDTLNPLLGTPPTPEFVERIRTIVLSHENILGAHDLIVHDYGPGRVMISLHAEVPYTGDLVELHDSIDNAEKDLKEQLGCDAVIHMDPVIIGDKLTDETRNKVAALITCIDSAITIHDFRMVSGPTHTNVIFDVVVPYGFRLTDAEVANKIQTVVSTLDSTYSAVLNIERSYT